MGRERLEIGEHGKITVTKKAGGVWVARTYYRDKTGKRRDITAQAPTKGRAQNKLQTKIAEYTPTDTGAINSATRFPVLAGYWAAQRADDPKSAPYIKYVVPRLIEHFKHLRLGEITPILVAEFIHAQAEPRIVDNRKIGGRASANRMLDVLRWILDIAVQATAIPSNPARLVKRLQKPRPHVVALTPDDLQKIRQNIRDYYASSPRSSRSQHYLPDLIEVLIGTGARVGEALALRWEDVDLETGLCHIRGTQRTDGTYQAHTKNGEIRAIRLPGWLVEILLRRREAGYPGERVICTVAGSPVLYSTLRRLKPAFGAEYEDIGFHDFRRAVATYLDRAVGAEGAALQLGHEDSVVTRRSYIERKGVADFGGLLDELG